jgi:hypothetical protein
MEEITTFCNEEKDIRTDIELSSCSPEKDEKHDKR